MNLSKQSSKSINIDRRQFNRNLASYSAALGLSAQSMKQALGSNEQINVGVIGCGGRAGSHIGMLMKFKEQGMRLDIVALCDTYRPRLMKTAERTKASFTTMRHEELLARPDVDHRSDRHTGTLARLPNPRRAKRW